MSTIKLLAFLALGSCFIHSCQEGSDEKISEGGSRDTLMDGCLAGFEIVENGDTINRIYGNNKIRQGHWIIFVLVSRDADSPLVKAKMEEGHYHHNKRTGFWKTYNKNGTVRDSSEYRDGALVIPL
jgi:hypothetical protein